MVVPQRRLAVVIVLATLASLASGENQAGGTLKGRLVGAFEHAPIRRAFILVHKHGSQSSGDQLTVDDNGSYSAKLPPGFYDVFVSSEGFSPACGQIAVEAGKTAVYNVKLKMSELVNQPD